ncbi:MAG: DUF2585 family protein [Candidatus Sungbacteria bacterium]|nr:DUF2585 family protein [Candidatus Sungbacteria bacterium]
MTQNFFKKIADKKYAYAAIATAIIALFGLALFFMGQVLICKCGYIKLWHGVVFSSENSQHLSDWYTFSHIIHGFIFYWIFWRAGKKYNWPLGLRFLLALLIEVGWELFENTDFIINRYREVTISLDYYGDSIVNSVFDVLMMVLGFFMAWRFPVWLIAVAAILMELIVGWYIRDNLILNIIMLVYPFDFILKWQSGG